MNTIKKIELGSVNIPEDAFDPKQTKIRISILIAGDLLDSYKSLAKKLGIGYQTLMQSKLREAIDTESALLGRLSKVESSLRNLERGLLDRNRDAKSVPTRSSRPHFAAAPRGKKARIPKARSRKTSSRSGIKRRKTYRERHPPRIARKIIPTTASLALTNNNSLPGFCFW